MIEPSRTLSDAAAENQSAILQALEDRAAGAAAQAVRAFENVLAPAFPYRLALYAVGGFGRRELFPHSDVDLMLLADRIPDSPDEKAALSEFQRQLWDGRLRISLSVRLPADCKMIHEGNLEFNISLLDARFLAGAAGLDKTFRAQTPRFLQISGPDLARHLLRLVRQRYAKFHDTIYHLEPDVKESPGGIRDIHLVHWLSQLRPIEDLGDAALLEAARLFMFNLRNRLHEMSGRDNNLLNFDAQEALSDNPEAWMREYFRHARVISRAATRAVEAAEGSGGGLLASFRDWRSRLATSEFNVTRERILFRSAQSAVPDPALKLKLFEFAGRHGFKLSRSAELRVELAVPAIAELVASKPHWPYVRELFGLPNLSLALRAMHETGALKAFFPEWERIECLVTRDFYHRYTVDEHTLVTIETLEELARNKDPQRERFRALLEETDGLPLLRVALLLHDAGKGSGEDHSIASVRLASSRLKALGASEQERATVLFLIQRHLELSSLMTSRDLSDPAVTRAAADRIGTIEHLKLLTLLTYADISAVFPGALTPWRMEQLWRAYRAVADEFTRELDSDRIRTEQLNERTPAMANFLDGLPTRYLRIHTEDEIQAHFHLAEAVPIIGASIQISRGGAAFHLCVVTQDRPYLLAAIAGALASFGLNIVKADVFGNRHGLILDTFVFTDPLHNLDLNPSELDRLKGVIERAISGKIDVQKLLQGRPAGRKRPSRVEPTVLVDNAASETATLVHVTAEDAPGLLYRMASAISSLELNIEVVLLDTEAHRALDVFYITRTGHKLDDATAGTLRDMLLEACSV